MNLNELFGNTEEHPIEVNTTATLNIGIDTIEFNITEFLLGCRLFGNKVKVDTFTIDNGKPSLTLEEMKSKITKDETQYYLKLDDELTKTLNKNIFVVSGTDIYTFTFMWLDNDCYIAFEEILYNNDRDLRIRFYTNLIKSIPLSAARVEAITDTCSSFMSLIDKVNTHADLLSMLEVCRVNISENDGMLEYTQTSGQNKIYFDPMTIFDKKNIKWLVIKDYKSDRQFVLQHVDGGSFLFRMNGDAFSPRSYSPTSIKLVGTNWLTDTKEIMDLPKSYSPPIDDTPKSETNKWEETAPKKHISSFVFKDGDIETLRIYLRKMTAIIDNLQNEPSIGDSEALKSLKRLNTNLNDEIYDIQDRHDYLTRFNNCRDSRLSGNRCDRDRNYRDYRRRGRGDRDMLDRDGYGRD